MRNKFFFLSLFLLNCIIAPFSLSGQYFLNWEYHDIFKDIQESGSNPDLAIGSTGVLHVSYWNLQEDRLVYAYKIPGSGIWIKEPVDSNSVCGHKSAIAISPAGKICIAYFYSNAGLNEVAYAERNAPGNWQISTLPSESGIAWGEYGPYATTIFSEFIRHSIDLIYTPAGEPVVYFFDAWYDILSQAGCTGYYSDYRLRLVRGERMGGVWDTLRISKPQDFSGSCFGFPLPDGDRFGESTTALNGANGIEHLVTFSFNNNWITHFTKFPGNSTLLLRPVDSLFGLFPCARTNSCCTGLIPPRDLLYYTTLESTAADMSPDGAIHISYTSSLGYGNDPVPSIFGKINTLGYTRIDSSGSLYHYNFFPNTCAPKNYYSLTSLAVKGNDSIFIAFTDKSDFYNLVAFSYDRGLSWTIDTVTTMQFPASNPVIKVDGDTLRLMLYRAESDQLFLHSSRIGSGNWRSEAVTFSQLRGQAQDSKIYQSGNDTIVALAYNDFLQKKLYFSKGTKNATLTWTHELLDSSFSGYEAIQVVKTQAGNSILFYHDLDNGNLMMATKVGAVWQFSIVDTASRPSYISALIDNQDSFHLAFGSAADSNAWYMRKHLSSGIWYKELIDSSSAPCGEYISLNLAADNRLRAAYHNSRLLALIFGERNGDNSWSRQIVDNDSTGSVGTYCELGTNSQSKPYIIHRDNFNNILYWAEKDTIGNWIRSVLDGSLGENIGSPARLEFDAFDKPWVVYNYSLGLDQVRMKMKDQTGWHTIGVSLAGRISHSFNFHIFGSDFFIVGKKSEIRNNGLAMLHARNGLYVEREAEAAPTRLEFTLFPNPAGNWVNILLKTDGDLNGRFPEIRVIDLAGKTILQQGWELGRKQMGFDTGGLSEGIYFVELSAGITKTVQKLVIRHN